MKKHSARCAHPKDDPGPCTVGIDVSKRHLDVRELPSGREAQFPNTREGVRAFRTWACPRVERVVYESTGSYHVLLEDMLVDRLPLSRINPQRGKRFAEALGSVAKTDRADALALAKMGRALADDLKGTPARTRQEKDLDELRKKSPCPSLVRREIEKDITRAYRSLRARHASPLQSWIAATCPGARHASPWEWGQILQCATSAPYENGGATSHVAG